MQFIKASEISKNFIDCNQLGLIEKDLDTTIIFYDFDFFSSRVDLLKKAFPDNTLHTIAIKANPLVKILERIQKIHLGVEVASEGELFLAEKTGFYHSQIVFDSPAKTNNELFYALSRNIHINADSFMELDRISQINQNIHSSSRIGLRINPQVGYGTIASTSVAGDYSKFGIPLKEYRNEIIESYHKYPWLTGIHIHIGSQGCSMQLLLSGFEEILKLIIDIQNKTSKSIEFFDIGGGLPVSYDHQNTPPDIVEYGSSIKKLLKKYNLEQLQLITEFGRYLHANSGYTLSKIEYAKHYKESNTLIIHAGADLFLRECLNPGQWPHEFTLFDNAGNIKLGNHKISYHIAGPLCFAGDIVARNIELPKADENDYLIIHDTGGYTSAMWSTYVSRMFPKVIMKISNTFEIIRNREKPEEIYNFWSVK